MYFNGRKIPKEVFDKAVRVARDEFPGHAGLWQEDFNSWEFRLVPDNYYPEPGEVVSAQD